MPSQSGSCSRKATLAKPTEKFQTSRLRRAIQNYMADEKETISTLNNLIETLNDGHKGFKEAADAVSDPQLKSLFAEYSQQRARFANDLQTEARSFGEAKPETGGSAAGAMHRGWINLKSAITSNDESAVLAECERGEDAAVEAFEKAMRDDLPSPAREVVSRQYSEIKSAHDRVKNLRDAAKKAT
jgi:uncharacterized protein (TIGR02284 family)